MVRVDAICADLSISSCTVCLIPVEACTYGRRRHFRRQAAGQQRIERLLAAGGDQRKQAQHAMHRASERDALAAPAQA
jgi:hypothetical protein